MPPVAPEAPPLPPQAARVARPLSPHLQVYRPQLTSILSITHRAAGVALAVGTLLLAWWLIAAATGPEHFATVQAVIGSWIGRLLLLGWTAALFFHFANGIRHLFWDAGLGFDLKTTYRSGWLVLFATVLLTAITWWWALT
jgi:succinate dehydrogenase / fumarate reductase, cytochrome b subunit